MTASLTAETPGMSLHASEPTPRLAWLSPEFAHQLVRTIVGALIAVLAAWFLLRSDMRSIEEKLAIQAATLSRVEGQLPNMAVYNLRLETLEKSVNGAKEYNRELLAYVTALRLSMERRGFDTHEPPTPRE